MRQDLQDKMATTIEACPHCGRPMSDYGCRPVPMGFWCLQYGLKADPRRIVGPTPDARQAIVDQTKDVKAAREAYQRAAAEDEQRTQVWREAQLRYHNAKGRRLSESQTVLVDGQLVSVYPPGLSDPEMGALQAAADEANALRVAAAEGAIAARQALDEAQRRAMRRLPAGV